MDPRKEKFMESFRGTNFRFSRLYSKFLSKVELTLPQYTLLYVIHEFGSVRMSEASTMLNLTKPAVTYIVDHLENRKLLKRDSHPTDRRVNLLKLESSGVKIIKEAQSLAVDVLMKPLNFFNGEEKKIIGKFFKMLVDELEGALMDSHGRGA